ncbi:elongation factor G [Desulfuromonas thiophila]|uniref:Elongation factor G n=1 Tax=Desulfuromonas thiophila TaxID=57664 RepID=A0A1G7DKR9_9BACT|nr:elongation factor G [Desulfuromonas thiophila]SDE52174.1 translation elongation factor 2 (EF-2/EF-G) [Desulfuromonas thiophila]
MAQQETTSIRNVGIVAHGGAGKTSLVEAMLFNTGMTDRLGKVDDGTSNMDFEPEEIKRRITISSSLHHCPWKDHSLHLVDTPGYSNFLHDTRNCLRVLGGGVLIVSAISGVKAQTQKIWQWAREYEVPLIAFVNKLDRERADCLRAVDDMEKMLGCRGVLVNMPLGQDGDFRGIIDLVNMRARLFQFDEKGTYREEDIPAEYLAEAQRLRALLLEAVADADDSLMEKYLENEDLSREDILQGLREGTLTGVFTPVLCGSATANIGVRQLLDYIVHCLPSPVDKGVQIGTRPASDEMVERQPDPQAPFSAMVFKTINDPFSGKLTLFRIYSGTLKSDSSVYNATREQDERVGQLYVLEGKKQVPIAEAKAGDIVAVAKMKHTATGDTLCSSTDPVRFDSILQLKPVISFALKACSKADEDKIHTGLQRLMEEDPTLQISRDEQTHEMILSGMGQVHIEVAVERLKRKYGVEVELQAPKVPYRETIRGKARLQNKYKKQSGGRGQYGDVWIELEPLAAGGGYEFVDNIVGGVIPRQYIPAVSKGIQEAMAKGTLGGYPVVDVKVTLFDGSHHSVDSSEMAFKIAGSMAFKKGMEQARPVLLEPIMQMEVIVPDDCIGDVIGDINSRRGRVLGVEPQAGSQAVIVQVPMAEVLRYAPELRSMTSDRGLFTMEFSHYEEVPSHLTAKVLAERNAGD